MDESRGTANTDRFYCCCTRVVKKEARWLKAEVKSDPTLSNLEKEEEYHVTVTVRTGKLSVFVIGFGKTLRMGSVCDLRNARFLVAQVEIC